MGKRKEENLSQGSHHDLAARLDCLPSIFLTADKHDILPDWRISNLGRSDVVRYLCLHHVTSVLLGLGYQMSTGKAAEVVNWHLPGKVAKTIGSL